MPVEPPSRLSSLDGLRGLAALAVVVYHCTKIVEPTLSGTAATVYRGVADSPVKVVFAGTEAVLVFFALSGLVVALPALRPGFSWRAYVGARLVRLYLPVWAALLLAAALIALVPRDPAAVTAGSWLQTASAHTVSAPSLATEATLAQPVYKIDNVLWSLRWELLFSLLLPLFVVVARLAGRRAVLAVLLCVAASVAGRLTDIDALVYLPVFLAGTVIASRLDDLRSWSARRGRAFWLAAGTASAALLIAGWLARPIIEPGTPSGRMLWGLAAAGAVGLMVTAVGSPDAARLLTRRVPRWLGRTSFSLYLVHVPILATLAYAWGDTSWPWVLAVGIPASLLTAAAFTKLVEAPSHALARAVRRRLSAVAVRSPASREPSAP